MANSSLSLSLSLETPTLEKYERQPHQQRSPTTTLGDFYNRKREDINGGLGGSCPAGCLDSSFNLSSLLTQPIIFPAMPLPLPCFKLFSLHAFSFPFSPTSISTLIPDFTRYGVPHVHHNLIKVHFFHLG